VLAYSQMKEAPTLHSPRLLLRPTRLEDAEPLAALLAEPEVARYWPDYDLPRVHKELIAGGEDDDDLTVLAIARREDPGRAIGLIQFDENPDPQYRHAGVDLFLGSTWHGRGLGSEAIRAVVDHLFRERGHHRITIDPAADNHRAIRAYERVGFRRVGVMERYERGPDGSWHDGLLMELVRPADARAEPAARYFDLSHTVTHGLVTYRGLPAPLICDYLSREDSRAHYAEGTEFHIGKIEMVANTGTYVDSPFHRYADGKDLADLELAQLADLEAVVLRARGLGGRPRAIDAADLDALPADLRGRAVLIDTGWDQHFATDRYFEGHPFLTEAAARRLVQARPALVGIDSLNIDDTADRRRPVHSLLLGADIPIVEHLTRLAQLPEAPLRFFAVPVKVRGFGTFPVRAFALRKE
jgi:arylformamidase